MFFYKKIICMVAFGFYDFVFILLLVFLSSLCVYACSTFQALLQLFLAISIF
jgi:hypothetical protein